MKEEISPIIRKKNRLPRYDYSQNGAYFVTICTQGQKHFFGKIKNGKMILNEKGKIAEKNWLGIPDHFSSVSLGEFVVMPNHMHGVLIFEAEFAIGENGDRHASPLRRKRQAQKLFRVIGSFKASVSKEICEKCKTSAFGWQRSFYDHVVRNEESLYRISEYIRGNPLQWESDKNRDHLNNIELEPLGTGMPI